MKENNSKIYRPYISKSALRSYIRLNDYIGRKSDGDPGWQTLWGGWLRLLDRTWAVEK